MGLEAPATLLRFRPSERYRCLSDLNRGISTFAASSLRSAFRLLKPLDGLFSNNVYSLISCCCRLQGLPRQSKLLVTSPLVSQSLSLPVSSACKKLNTPLQEASTTRFCCHREGRQLAVKQGVDHLYRHLRFPFQGFEPPKVEHQTVFHVADAIPSRP